MVTSEGSMRRSRRVPAFLRRALGGRRRVDGPLARVIHDRSVNVVYQPIQALRDGAIVGVEALARIPAGTGGSPGPWFDRARQAGRSVDLDLVAAEAAIAAIDVLPDDVYLSVNLTPAGLKDDRVRRLFHRGHALVVEITEHDIVDDYEELGESLAALRSQGVRFAVDDTGAGWATLRHVLEIRPEIIKLDATLITKVTTDDGAQAMTRALVGFGKDIGATVIAEGVEHLDQLDTLRRLGVEHVQGFAVGRPSALSDVENLALSSAATGGDSER